ncbi:MAG: FAD:protein FMN transferase [Fluviicola sp.]
MFGILKHKGLTLLLILSSLFVGCTSDTAENTKKEKENDTANEGWNQIEGSTQGTTYGVILEDPNRIIQKAALDSILHDFDLALSTYIDSSVISYVNRSDAPSFRDPHGYFENCWNISKEVSKNTKGAFDPTVFPLVEAWGFFGDSLQTPTDEALNGILQRVGFENCELNRMSTKILSVSKQPGAELDFNAVAQGYAVDVLADYLDQKGIKNFYVEIGGEVVVKGNNREGMKWRIGIDSPQQEEGKRVIENIVNISDKAIATSGNYRKFYMKDGVKYAHTINPTTGKPVQHSLLSASVIANTCAEADAYATAFMVMGVERSMEFVKNNSHLGLEIYLVYDDGSGRLQREITSGFEKYLK